ncbi:sensor histidine kinase [Aurantimonas sp. Leaf443]|uniref:sensor histidine kinase n=1 Tax=Aurantimonas sp. Leaf443 TaxID=1736378 RepID=UPI0006F65EA9|nr:sensor histidine kinase [Aurantimonas sp. Leaf443]KQT83161.1 histidine kinase [Aurantimonas sp. Leaf443]
MKLSDRLAGPSFVAALTAGFALMVFVGIAATWTVLRSVENAERLTHTVQVQYALAELRSLSERAETARRGYLLEPDERFAQSFEVAAQALPETMARISDLVGDNAGQSALVRRLSGEIDAQIASVRTSIAQAAGDDATGRARRFVEDGAADYVRQVRLVTQDMDAAEARLFSERSEASRRSIVVSLAALVVAGLFLLLLAALTIWASRRNAAELAASRDRLRLLNEDLEGEVAVRTADLTRANEEIQRFAYIVSHDLRSPLVNVMGFTAELDAAVGQLGGLLDRVEAQAPDLVSADDRLAVREDLPESIRFIRTSTQKMDRLINAILRLSREGRRVVTPERLDMNELVSGIVASMQHRLGETGAEITVEPLPAIVTDRVAIEQIFSNLIENAVKYLKPGRPGRITVRGQRLGDRVLFEVEDNGRGIDPKDHDRVFDLFRRSGVQDQPGEGIGLAHVRAMAYRLGGMIGCRSALDEGATFRLSMPAQSAVS